MNHRDFALGVSAGVAITFAAWKLIEEFSRPNPDFSACIPHIKYPPPLHPHTTKWDLFTDPSFQLCKINHMVPIDEQSVLLCINSVGKVQFQILNLLTKEITPVDIGLESVSKLRSFPNERCLLAQNEESIYQIF